MAKPAKPKTLKPKAEDETPAGGSAGKAPTESSPMNMIVMILAIVISSVLGTAGSVYLVSQMVLLPAIQSSVHAAPAAGDEAEADPAAEGEGDGHVAKVPKVGMNLELEEFTVNLKKEPGVKGNQFLRTKISLSLTVPEAEDCHAQAAHEAEAAGKEGGGHGGGEGGGGHGEAAPKPAGDDPCQVAFSQKMGRFVPTIRDIINTTLMKRTAGQLTTLEGQEALKDEMSQEITYLMNEDGYKVLRINLEDFIIQR